MTGATLARFRLSTVGGLAPTGPAADGEVEDHVVTIRPPVVRPGGFGDPLPIPLGPDPVSLCAPRPVDLDRDGDLDLLAADSFGRRIVWFEKNGPLSLVPHTIATGQNPTDATAADIDRDGDLDVVSADSREGVIAWHENDGRQQFSRHVVADRLSGALAVVEADFDRDGDVDLAAAASLRNTVLWFENDGLGNFAPHTIDATLGFASALATADLDGDGDRDLVASGARDGLLVWYEQTAPGSFARREISSRQSGTRSIQVADLNGDGRLDVVAGLPDRSEVVWWENAGPVDADPANDGTTFVERRVADGTPGINSVTAGDMDGDGDLDVVAAYGRRIGWFRNQGAGTFVLSQEKTFRGTFCAVVFADFDDDDDLDVVGTPSQPLPSPPDRPSVPSLPPYVVMPNNLPLGATILPVVPNPRFDAVPRAEVHFEQDVTGVDLPDFTLTRDGVAVPLGGVRVVQVSPSIYTVRLDDVTATPGRYVFSLHAENSGIRGPFGALVASPSVTWQVDAVIPGIRISEVVPDQRPDAVDELFIQFTEPVTGVDIADFRLRRDGQEIDLRGSRVRSLTPMNYAVDVARFTAAEGRYEFRFVALGSGVRDLAGNAIDRDGTEGWTVTPADGDADRVLDVIETRAPNNGDGNKDGTPDDEQAHVTSIPNKFTGRYVTLVSPPATRLVEVRVERLPLQDAPSDIAFQLGLMNFEVQNVPVGGAVDVTLLFDGGARISTYYKFGATPDNPTPHFYRFVWNKIPGTPGAEILEDRIILHLIDGQLGDDDLTRNGTIRDPGLPGVDQRDRPWQHPKTPIDVNDDRQFSPLDALVIIGELNRNGSRRLPAPLIAPNIPNAFFDVNGDGQVSPLDALFVIGDLNRNGSRRVEDLPAEGEPLWPAESAPATLVEESLGIVLTEWEAFPRWRGEGASVPQAARRSSQGRPATALRPTMTPRATPPSPEHFGMAHRAAANEEPWGAWDELIAELAVDIAGQQ